MPHNRKVLQIFEGYVDNVDIETLTFSAVLIDLTEPDNLDEYGEFDFSVFDTEFHYLIQPGYIFRWEIGETYNEDTDESENYSEFRFLKYTRKEIAKIRKSLVKAKKKAKYLSVLFV